MRSKSLTTVIVGTLTVLAMTSCAAETPAGSTKPDADCKAKHSFDTVAPGTITVSARTAYPPYIQTTGDKIAGVDGDIINKIALRECLSVKVFAVDNAAGHVEAVKSGRADIAIGNIYRSKERTKVASLSDPIYVDQMAIMSRDGRSDIDSLAGQRIGTIQGYLWNDDLKEIFGSSLKMYPSALNVQQDLAAGRLDVGIDGYGAAKYAAKSGNMPGIEVVVAKKTNKVAASLQPGQAGFLLSLKNEPLTEAVNEDIAQLHESGEIAEILKRNGLPVSAADTGDPRLVG